MPDPSYRYLAEAILVTHQRREDGNCMCGVLKLGESWAKHVAMVLQFVGALRDGPPKRVEDD
jgi:hypothetical protein